MRPLLAWLADMMLGPLCPYGCGYRARGPRTMNSHRSTCLMVEPETYAERLARQGDE